MSEKKDLICFLVSPFGDKTHQMQKGKGAVGQYELIRSSLKEIIEGYPDANIQFKRADEILDVGNVAETFIAALYGADIVIAELSATSNANVFYELGIRYALRRGITIPVWQKGTELPADLKGVLGIEYDQRNSKADQEKFYDFIRQRLRTRASDSPVYRILPDLEIVTKAELELLRTEIIGFKEKLQRTAIEQSAQVLLEEAEQLLAKGNPNGALKNFQLAYKQAPDNLSTALRYGKLLSRLNKHDDAIDVLIEANRVAERSESENSVLKRELGLAYTRANKLHLALEVLENVVSIADSDADSFGIIGGIYKQKYELDKAIDAYGRGFEVDEQSIYCLLNLIALLLIRDNKGDKINIKKLLLKADLLTIALINAPNVDHWAQFDRAHYLLFAKAKNDALDILKVALQSTKTIGELESARKNLDLLKEFDANISGLDEAIALVEDRKKVLIQC